MLLNKFITSFFLFNLLKLSDKIINMDDFKEILKDLINIESLVY